MKKPGRKPIQSVLKLLVVRKYIYGKSAIEVLKRERSTPADECWLDEDWKKNQQTPRDAVGFSVEVPDHEYSDDESDI